jgi:hypothetical protein
VSLPVASTTVGDHRGVTSPTTERRPAPASTADLSVTTWSPFAAGAAAGALAAVATLAMVVVGVLGTWMLAPHSGEDAVPLAAGATVWLAGHGLAVTVEGLLADTTIRFAPLGAVALFAAAAAVAGRRAARISLCSGAGDWVRVSLSVGAGYSLVALLVLGQVGSAASVAAGGLAGVAVIAAIGALVGSAQVCDSRPLRLLPARLQVPAIAAAAALAVLILGSAALFAVSVLLRFGEVRQTLTGVGGDAAGAVALALLSLLAVPTMLLWVIAVAAGPGVALGASGSLTAVAVELPPLPAFPLFAALPPAGSSPPALLLLLLPVLAGAVAGIVIHRRTHGGDEPARLVAGLLTGLLTAAVIAVACWLGGIVVGAGQPLRLGPTALPVAVSLTIVVGGTAAVVAWEAGRLSRRRLREGLDGLVVTARSIAGRAGEAVGRGHHATGAAAEEGSGPG